MSELVIAGVWPGRLQDKLDGPTTANLEAASAGYQSLGLHRISVESIGYAYVFAFLRSTVDGNERRMPALHLNPDQQEALLAMAEQEAALGSMAVFGYVGPVDFEEIQRVLDRQTNTAA